MNSFGAANLFENPLVLVTLVLASALANWLMKRRGKARPEISPNESASPPLTDSRGHPAPQPDLQALLRQLLGGEPPVTAPSPPPVPHVFRDDQTPALERDEEPLHSELRWPDESLKAHERLLPQKKQIDAQSSALAARIQADDRQENSPVDLLPFVRQAKHPVRATGTARRRLCRVGGTGVRLWRDPRVVRRAFVASLVFAPPKGLEA